MVQDVDVCSTVRNMRASPTIMDECITEGRTKERPIMPIRTLAEAISHYGHDAYLLTVAQDGPHTSHVTIELRGSSIGCAVGAAAGERRATGVTMAEITLTKSVLHRPGPRPDDSDGPCANDCRRLTR